MGCVPSKQGGSVTPVFDHSRVFGKDNVFGSGGVGMGLELDLKKLKKKRSGRELVLSEGSELGDSERASSSAGGSESVAAGWPSWLIAAAGEAIQGWVPLRAESFQKLEKIGQGTYSNVFKARDLESGKIVALKKVRFDKFEPGSVRFMAREINILRRLDHPNIIKLEGIITSRLSSSIYLVFEYMEHDVTGLLSRPDVKFSEAQIKCFMRQLLSGIEHYHSRGVMHRDIKGANLLVNNEGILKVADFGLANFCNFGQKQPLTSRVVTLWYRPPELLLGSSEYGVSVDLWSVGCVFAELLTRRPILQGRTEVEQLHKIFKLCGSPPDDYWKNSRLPHATLFKPHHSYESCLWETFKDLPKNAVTLIETLLSVEPHKRGTASSALDSEYFKRKPYACDPSSLPKYPPSKEIDAKQRAEARRKRAGGRTRSFGTTRKLTKKPNGFNKLAPEENLPIPTDGDHRTNGENLSNCKGGIISSQRQHKSSMDASRVKNASQEDVALSGPLQVSGSSGFAWAKQRVDDLSSRSRSRSSSRSSIFETSGASHSGNMFGLKRDDNGDDIRSRINDSHDTIKHTMLKQWNQLLRPDSFDASDGYHSQELSQALYQKEEMAARRTNLVYRDKVEFSGPLLSQSHRVEELLQKHERQIRQASRRSWFQRVRKH